MKQINLKIAVILISSFTLFSFASNRKSYQTECISMEMDGYITLKIWDSKKGVKYTSEQSRKDAIHAILYSGIAGSKGCTTLSPLLSRMGAQENFKNIEKSFFSKKGKWTMFTRSSEIETTLPENLGIKNWKVYQVSVSKNELRKHLEEQKIIKALNNGF